MTNQVADHKTDQSLRFIITQIIKLVPPTLMKLKRMVRARQQSPLLL